MMEGTADEVWPPACNFALDDRRANKEVLERTDGLRARGGVDELLDGVDGVARLLASGFLLLESSVVNTKRAPE